MAADLPTYVSHKKVQAAPIADVSPGGGCVSVRLNGELVRVDVPPGFFARSTPIEGDYLVIYDDGYMAHSPKRAFEDGYKRAEG
jgi:hypothetical protein